MPHFMSEEEAIAVIERNMDKIEARMASGSNANTSAANSSGEPSQTSNQPCNGDCSVDPCCNCCVC